MLTCDKYIPDVLLGTQAERVALEDCKEDSSGEAQGYGTFVDDLIKTHADWSARLKTLERKMLDKMLGPGHLSSCLVLKDSKIQLSQSS